MKTTLDNAIDSLEIHKRSVLPMAQFCTEITLVLNAARRVESSPPPKTCKGCHPSHAREIKGLQQRIDAIRNLPPNANVYCHTDNIAIYIDFANFVEMFRGRKCLVKDDGWYKFTSEDGVEFHAQKRQQPKEPQEVVL